MNRDFFYSRSFFVFLTLSCEASPQHFHRLANEVIAASHRLVRQPAEFTLLFTVFVQDQEFNKCCTSKISPGNHPCIWRFVVIFKSPDHAMQMQIIDMEMYSNKKKSRICNAIVMRHPSI